MKKRQIRVGRRKTKKKEEKESQNDAQGENSVSDEYTETNS